MLLHQPVFDDHVGKCGVATGDGACGKAGVARVQVATYDYDYTEWGPYVGQDVMVDVCDEHCEDIEADYKRALAAEEERVERREAASERVRELEEQLRQAQRERDRI